MSEKSDKQEIPKAFEENVVTTTTIENWVTESNGSGKWVPYQRTTQETTRRGKNE